MYIYMYMCICRYVLGKYVYVQKPHVYVQETLAAPRIDRPRPAPSVSGTAFVRPALRNSSDHPPRPPHAAPCPREKKYVLCKCERKTFTYTRETCICRKETCTCPGSRMCLSQKHITNNSKLIYDISRSLHQLESEG